MTNRYGLDSVAFRAGTHATFKAAMLDAIAADTSRALRTRDDDDFAIALLDAWAVAADVLTFYDERTINEFFLRTATDPASLIELSRLVGYRPRPGLAASTYLAYTIADPPPPIAGLTDARGRAPETIPIATGAKAQNTPAPGTLPQTFETTAPLDARVSGNALVVRSTLNYLAELGDANPVLYVTGSAPQLGDRVLIATSYDYPVDVRPVLSVEPVTGATAVRTLASGVDDRDPATVDSLPDPPPWPSGPLTNALVGAVRNRRWEQRDFAALAHANGWPLEDVGELVDRAVAADPPPIRAWTLRSAGNLFGYNAPLWASLSESFRAAWQTEWPNGWPNDPALDDDPVLGINGTVPHAVDLDGVATWIVPGRLVRLVGPAATIVARVEQRSEIARTDYALSAKVTRLHLTVLTPGGDLGALSLRSTTVEVADRELALAPVPAHATAGGTTILLDRCIAYVSAGQPLALSGERADRPGVRDTEIIVPDDVTIDDGRTRLFLTQSPPVNRYVAATVRINANVVPASHGETRGEAIGSGDGSAAFQRFRLSQRPLTWLSAAVPGGIDAALTVRVDGVAWTRVDRFYGRGPSERIYVVDYDSDGYAYVCTGDGITGARVPSGTENVVATYRQGLGAAGLLDAHALTLAITRPVGVKAVDNPVPATGAADPETLDDARANAAIGLRSLERIVSLDDYVDFVRASAGIAKADVIMVPRVPTAIVLITVAGPGGTPIVPGSRQATDLATAIDAASAGRAGVMLVPYRPVTFRVAARIAVDPAYDRQAVYDAIETALRSAFGFANRTFAAPVNSSDVVAVVQGVPGVVALALDALYRADGPVANADCTAAPASLSAGGQAVGAELLTLDPGPLVLGELS